ncbi:hypothetical protein ACNQR7_30535 [Mycolicibacterium senegalense]|uniref:hypothetical protein n=1 Tax=Mycobacteriaceae TaxID=1762 RepID=UPI003AABF36C
MTKMNRAEKAYELADDDNDSAANVVDDDADAGDEDAAVELVRDALLEAPDPGAQYFSRKLQELASTMSVRMLDGSGKTRKLTPLRLQKLLKQEFPQLPVSQTQIYRYYHGQAVPRVDVVIAVANLFGVSPREFLPE